MKRKLSKKYVLIFIYSGLAGIIIGTIVFFFRYGLIHLSQLTRDIYSYINNHLYFIPLLLISLALLATIVYFLIKKLPFVQGGGIARTEGLLRGLIPISPVKLGIGTILSTIITYFSGVPLGTEGLIIGSSVGDAIAELDQTKASKRYVMSAGAAAGFAVSTAAPLTGIVFILERMHKRFSFLLVIVLLSGVAFAYGISLLWGNLLHFDNALFSISTDYSFIISDIWIFIIIGIIIGFFTILFTFLLRKTEKGISKVFKEKKLLKLIINFLLVGITGVFVVDALGNGTHLINLLLNTSFELQMVIILFIAKLFLILISAQSGATGGMFGPVLVLGALLGKMISSILVLFGLDSSYEVIIILAAMTTFFGTAMNSPITAMIFAFESTIIFMQSYLLIIPILIGLAICHLTKAESINDVLLSTMLRRSNKDKKPFMAKLDGIVTKDAFVIGNQARDILWPANCYVASLKRSDNIDSDITMVKSGDKHFHAGDVITFSVQTYDIEETKRELMSLIGKQELLIHK